MINIQLLKEINMSVAKVIVANRKVKQVITDICNPDIEPSPNIVELRSAIEEVFENAKDMLITIGEEIE